MANYDSEVANVYRQLAPKDTAGLSDDEVIGVAKQLDPNFEDNYRAAFKANHPIVSALSPNNSSDGELKYTGQHPISAFLDRAGEELQKSIPYNPATYLGAGFGKVANGIDTVAQNTPSMMGFPVSPQDVKSGEDLVFGTAKKGFDDLGMAADYAMDTNHPAAGFGLGALNILGAVASPRNLGDLALASPQASAVGAQALGGVGDALKGIAAKALPDISTVEGWARSKLGQLGGAEKPFDELARIKSGQKAELDAQQQARDALAAQKAKTLDARQQLIGAQQAREADMDPIRKNAFNRDAEAGDLKDSVDNQLSSIEDKAKGAGKFTVGQTILDKTTNALEADEQKNAFDQRYDAVNRMGEKVDPQEAPEIAAKASSMRDTLETILNTSGDAKIKRAAKFFLDMTQYKNEQPEAGLSDYTGSKKVNFNEAVESQKVLGQMAWDEYSPKTKSMSKQGVQLMDLKNTVGKFIARAAADKPELLSDLDNLSQDYAAHRLKWDDFLKRIKGGDIEPSDVPNLLLNKTERQLKTEDILGQDGLQTLRSFRTRQILGDIAQAARDGKDPVGAVQAHFSGTLADANKSLYAPEEVDALHAIAERLRDSMGASDEAKQAAAKEFAALQQMQNAPEPKPNVFKLGPGGEPIIEQGDYPEPIPEKQRIQSRDRRVNDIPSGDKLRREGDASATEKLSQMFLSNKGRISLTAASTFLMHSHPYLSSMGLALGYGPELLARAYMRSPLIKEAANSAIKSIGTAAQGQNLSHLSQLMAVDQMATRAQNEEGK